MDAADFFEDDVCIVSLHLRSYTLDDKGFKSLALVRLVSSILGRD